MRFIRKGNKNSGKKKATISYISLIFQKGRQRFG